MALASVPLFEVGRARPTLSSPQRAPSRLLLPVGAGSQRPSMTCESLEANVLSDGVVCPSVLEVLPRSSLLQYSHEKTNPAPTTDRLQSLPYANLDPSSP